MSSFRRVALSGAFVISLIPLSVAGWWGFSPWVTVQTMQSAIVDGDAESFSAHVDYPMLRQSIRTEARARLQAEAARTPPFSLKALGLSLALEYVDGVVDSAVSPETLGLVLAGTASAGAWIDTPGLTSLSMLALPALEIRRDGLDRFTLSAADSDGAPELLFRRDGLQWRLSGVHLPPPADRDGI